MTRKIITLSAILLVAAFYFASSIDASEGTVELRSTTGQDYRCFASSIQMQNGVYNVSISCRDLIYPVEETITAYVLWADVIDQEQHRKFGRLDYGKKTFNINAAFSSLFVTTEPNPGVRQPQGRVVMQGVVQPITFLDRPTTATPSPQDEDTTDEQTQDETDQIVEDVEESEEELTTREKLVLGLKRAGVVAFFALIALVGLIFVITRSRG